VPATSARLPGLLFLMRLLTVLMKLTRLAGYAIKQSKLLCLWLLESDLGGEQTQYTRMVCWTKY
jgi:hypothetical protein